jgi:UDP-glucuronate 4-epimerase
MSGPILVTGTAGFIGYHVTEKLLSRGHQVVGVDNMNAYYEVSLKEARLARIVGQPGFSFEKVDVADRPAMADLFARHRFDRVLHLAAQAGVRHSLTHPHVYADSNIVGFLNVLEGCRHGGVRHLAFASSSSVYGGNTRLPFSVDDPVDHPVSLYAATKRANELMAHCYAHLYGLPCTGLRFFTVYGPWGRPDMALFMFTRAILAGEPIDLFNHGDLQRDFTYVDDVVESVVRVLDRVPTGDATWNAHSGTPARSFAPYRIYNIGNHDSVPLKRFVEAIEATLGKKAEKKLLPMQQGDVHATYADVEDLVRDVEFRPHTPIEEGIGRFVAWYLSYYGPAPRG